MVGYPTREELERRRAWEQGDQVPGRPEMTAFRRRLRYHQAVWREAHGHPIGTQPIAPRAGQHRREVGSRLPLDYAQKTGANFITAGALKAAKERLTLVEPNQSIDHQRIWADMLWSPAIAFNLFGDLAGNPTAADRAVHVWWPKAQGKVLEIAFSHSPGWLDPRFLNSLRVFDAMISLGRRDGPRGVIALDIKYHERAKAETPRPENLRRYREVAEQSGAFRRGAFDKLKPRTELAVMWLEHLLLLSMLQHPSRGWNWGMYVVVHAQDNSDFSRLSRQYADLLSDPSTFATVTLEELLNGKALARRTARSLRERYIP